MNLFQALKEGLPVLSVVQIGRMYEIKSYFALPDELKGGFVSKHAAEQRLKDFQAGVRAKVRDQNQYTLRSNAKRKLYKQRKKAEALSAANV